MRVQFEMLTLVFIAFGLNILVFTYSLTLTVFTYISGLQFLLT